MVSTDWPHITDTQDCENDVATKGHNIFDVVDTGSKRSTGDALDILGSEHGRCFCRLKILYLL